MTSLDLLPGEHWWGGAVADGLAMPFGARVHERDLSVNAGLLDDPESGANQSAPLLLSDAGRVVWSEHAFRFRFEPERLEIDSDVVVSQAIEPTLRGAFRYAAQAHFPTWGRAPARALFEAPQYNTWIEHPYTPTQQGVLDFARGLLAAGFPPGVLMIDDDWALDYGVWRFDRARFPEPTAMVDELHALGFAVMLWVVPFVSPDSAAFRELDQQGGLLLDADGGIAIRRWWNGFSAVLDLTDERAERWLTSALDRLRNEHGIDGFKFDGGDVRHFRLDDHAARGMRPVDQTEAWGRIGAAYAFNEFRAGWKPGGLPLAERLHDKPPTWGANGLLSLIPEGIAQGLIGAPFCCADMVGGGELGSFGAGQSVDQEQFVRYAQCAALFPMVQFSMSPARVLDTGHLAAVLAAVELRRTLLPDILRLVDHAAATGEPVLRAVAYHHTGFAEVRDQFLLGEDILVAPVLERGATTRRVVIPPGDWRDADGTRMPPGVRDLPVDLHSLPVFFQRRGEG